MSGWYAWPWVPWMLVAMDDLTVRQTSRWRPWVWGSILLVVSTIAWFTRAHAVYAGG